MRDSATTFAELLDVQNTWSGRCSSCRLSCRSCRGSCSSCLVRRCLCCYCCCNETRKSE